MQIFLAHAKEDIDKVKELYDRLKGKGYKPWLDEKDLLPGQKWREEIPRAIKNSDFIIICFSSTSVAKEGYLQREFKLALNQAVEKTQGTIFLLPVRLDRCEVPDIQLVDYGENLRDYQWVNYYENDGFERLVCAIELQRSKITGKSKISDSESTTADNLVTVQAAQQLSKNSFEQQRLKDLADNIARSQKLLKEFEKALDYERDPRIKAKYEQDIKRQQDAIAGYEREYHLLINKNDTRILDPKNMTNQPSTDEKLIEIHQRRLQKLKEQEAYKGQNTPPEILLEIEDLEAKIANLQGPK